MNFCIADSPKEILGEIKKYMYIHDISQDEIADRLHISKQAMSSKFKEANPSLKSLFEIMDAIDVQMEYRIIPKKDGAKKA